MSWMDNEGWNQERLIVEYEKQIDNVIGNYQTISLCTYSLNKCSATEIIDVVANHQFALVKKEGEWERIEHSERKKAEEAVQATINMENTFNAVLDPNANQDQALAGKALCTSRINIDSCMKTASMEFC